MRDATRPVSPGSAEASSPWTAACSFRTGPRAWLTVGALRAAPIFLWPGWISIFVLQPLHHHMPGIFARRCASVSVRMRRVNRVQPLFDRCVPGVLAEPSRTAYAVSGAGVCDRSVLPAFFMFRGALQEKWPFGS